MKYTSKYIEEILTSPAAKRGLDYITPVYHEAYVALWIMQAIGIQTDLIVKWAAEVERQILPQSATWLLPYWEEEYGIPVNDALPLESRRKHVLSVIRNRAPMNPARLEELAKLALGIDSILVKEHVAKNTFSFVLEEALNQARIRKLHEMINPCKPAHLIYFINIYTRTQFINHEKFFFNRLNIQLHAPNLGLEVVCLNGQRRLDGSWHLQSITKAPRLQSLKIAVHAGSLGVRRIGLDGQRSLDGAWFLYAVSGNPYLRKLKMQMRMKNPVELSVGLTRRTLWRLDGRMALDGTKVLSEDMEKESI